jgi:diguanylate cyclase
MDTGHAKDGIAQDNLAANAVIPTRDPQSLDARRQAQRMRAFFAATVNYVLDALVLLAYAWHGTISWSAWSGYLAFATLASLVFWAWIASGRNKGMADPSLTGPQMFVCGCIQLASLAVSPQLLVFFLSNLFVMAVLGTLQFGKRGFFVAWALSVAGVAAVVLSVAQLQVADNDTFERWMLVIAFAVVLARFAALTAQFSALRNRLHQQNLELEKALTQVAQMAVTDGLTGVPNRREIMRLLADELAHAQRRQTPFCVAIMDIDFFKKVNDRFGHAAGDAVLKAFADTIMRVKRETDRFGRYGGEEFIMAMGDTLQPQALVALDRLRAAVEAYDWPSVEPSLKVTVSIGCAQWIPGESLETAMERADQALYRAKEAGRNRVEA